MTVTGRSHFRSNGFTLVEILVALTLFSLIQVMIFNGLYSAGLSWQKGEDQSASNDTQRLELAFLRRQLSQAVPLIKIDAKENPVLFRGGHESIRFVSDLPSHRGGGGLAMLDVRIEQQEGSWNLVLAYQPVRPEMDFFADERLEGADSQVLLQNIDGVEFSYYGNQKTGDTPAWHDDWDSNDRLPTAIRMRITPGDSRQYYPEIVLPVYTQAIKGQPQLTLDARHITGVNQ